MHFFGADVKSQLPPVHFQNSNKTSLFLSHFMHTSCLVSFWVVRAPFPHKLILNFYQKMTPPIIMSVNFRGECKLIPIVDGFSFDQFVALITGKWVDLGVSDFSCTCTVGSISGFCLDNDYDLNTVILLCKQYGENIVQVVCVNEAFVVGDKGGSVFRANTNLNYGISGDNNVSDSIRTDSVGDKRKHSVIGNPYVVDDTGTQSEFGGTDSLPIYDVCPTLKKPTLLSDGWENIMEGGVGQVFSGGVVEFRSELIKYTTKKGFRFRYVRNERRYVHVVCKEECTDGCEWFIKARRQPVTDYFEIYRSNPFHQCVGNLVSDTSRLGSKLIGVLVLQKVKATPTIGGKEIIQLIKDSYGFEISYSRAWRTIEAARSMIFGSYTESYEQLRWYCNAILQTNPGSVVHLEHNTVNKSFERVFIAFKACIDGFRFCRPILFLDGTFMKGRAKGTLLSATAKDGNNGLFPVAFAVVSAENKENWTWFLEKLRDFIKHDKLIIYISDRNCGLMAAFPLVFQDPQHFFCLYHLLTNLKGRFSTGWTAQNRTNLGQHFKECAYAPNMRLFEEKLRIFLEVGGITAEKWLKDIPYEKWAVAYSPHITRYGEMTSNAAESFNSWIREARALPITYMVDYIKEKMSQWYVDRREMANTWSGALCSNKEELWNKLCEMGRAWFVVKCTDGSYQVASSPTALVDVRKKACSCYQWQVRGFPCAHAVAVIRKVSPSIYEYVTECFFAKNYKDCYRGDIHFIPETLRFECQEKGPHDPNKIRPPVLKRQPGRPKKGSRITSYGEFKQKKTKRTCERCGKLCTHDSTTCATQF